MAGPVINWVAFIEAVAPLEEKVCNCPACRAARRGDYVPPEEVESPFGKEFDAILDKILNNNRPDKALNDLENLADSLGIPLPRMPGMKKPKKRKRYYDDLPF